VRVTQFWSHGFGLCNFNELGMAESQYLASVDMSDAPSEHNNRRTAFPQKLVLSGINSSAADACPSKAMLLPLPIVRLNGPAYLRQRIAHTTARRLTDRRASRTTAQTLPAGPFDSPTVVKGANATMSRIIASRHGGHKKINPMPIGGHGSAL
jgi:hypothetical protein